MVVRGRYAGMPQKGEPLIFLFAEQPLPKDFSRRVIQGQTTK
jgi:hypothetical protein